MQNTLGLSILALSYYFPSQRIKIGFSLPEAKNEWFGALPGCGPMFSTMGDRMVRSYTVYTPPVYSIQTPLASVLRGHSIPPAESWTSLELHKVAW